MIRPQIYRTTAPALVYFAQRCSNEDIKIGVSDRPARLPEALYRLARGHGTLTLLGTLPAADRAAANALHRALLHQFANYRRTRSSSRTGGRNYGEDWLLPASPLLRYIRQHSQRPRGCPITYTLLDRARLVRLLPADCPPAVTRAQELLHARLLDPDWSEVPANALADWIGISEKTLRRTRRGEHQFTNAQTADALARFLNVQVGLLAAGGDIRAPAFLSAKPTYRTR